MKTIAEKIYTLTLPLLLLVLLIAFAFIPSALKAQPTPMSINFVDGNIDNARQIAKQQGKHILVEFTGLSCPACRKMELEVLTNTDVILLVNQYFVPIKIYVEDTIDQANWQLQEQLHPQFLPTFYIYNQDKLQETIVGFKQKDDFLNLLNAFISKEVHHFVGHDSPPPKQSHQEIPPKAPIEPTTIPDPRKHIALTPTPLNFTIQISATEPPKQDSKLQIIEKKDTPKNIEVTRIAPVLSTSSFLSNVGKSAKSQNVETQPISKDVVEPEMVATYKGSPANMDDRTLREACYHNKTNYKNYEQFVEEYIKRHGKDIVQKDRDFVFDFAIRLDDSASKLLLSNIDAFKDIYGAQKVENQLTQAMRQLLIAAISNNKGAGDAAIFEYLTKAITNAHIVKQDSLLFEIKSQYFQGTRNWESYHQICRDYFSKHKDNPDLLLGQAKAHLLQIDRKEMLQKALEWAETALEIEPSAEAYFVIGALYDKLHKNDEAIKYLSQSIEWSKAQKSDDILARELLEKITR
ncbi:MAG: thioredoxin family protein [Chitinophagales bacterium]|nr:thioredoxin family protein [Chitinophagales bacterium]